MEELDMLDQDTIQYVYGGEEEFVVDPMDSDSNFLGQIVYSDGNTIFVQDGTSFVLSDEQTIMLQDDASNADEIIVKSELQPELFLNGNSMNTYEHETSLQDSENDSNFIQYTVMEDAVKVEPTNLTDDNAEIVDISHVLGKNLITGQTVTLENYLERISKTKSKLKIEKKINNVLNKKISLGVTVSGKKLYGKILHIQRKVHEPIIDEEPKWKMLPAETVQDTLINDDKELSEEQFQFTISVLENLKEYVQRHPLIIHVLEQQAELTVNLGVMRGCLDSNEDGTWTYVNFNHDNEDVNQLKYLLRYINPIVLSITLEQDETGLKLQKIMRDPTYNQNICLLCYKETKSLKMLQKHYCIHHAGFLAESEAKIERPPPPPVFECAECDRIFTNASSLRRHQAVHNPDLRAFECTLCTQRFTDNTSLSKHLLTHTGIKPHVCNICKRGFTSIGDLNTHRKTHYAGCSMYSCSTCGRTFSRQSNLERHARVHNNGAHFCHICGCTYKFLSSLTRHIVQTHGVGTNNVSDIITLAE